MPVLGGSPLGIIGVSSGPTRDGMSTFNAGKSRNLNVNLYNSGKEADKEKVAKAKQSQKGGAFSLFTGGSFIKPWPNIKVAENSGILQLSDDGYSGVSRRTLHNNDVYDISILNLIEKTAGTSCRLRPTDFAYLKDVGLYPNNRLVIARRFSGGISDDIYKSGSSPLAVLITWRKPDEDFLEISFGEEWEEAKASFTDLLNNITEDLMGKKAGGSITGGLGAIPIPGWSEALQNEVLVALEIKEAGVLNRRLPAGDPNLIKTAKRRKTVPYGEAGSGLKCTVNIKMLVEYEQKFISGIDPTIAYMDIIQNALRFGTSTSVDYGLSNSFAAKLMKWVRDPKTIITDLVNAISKAVEKAKTAVLDFLDKEISEADDGRPKDDEKEPSEKDQLLKQRGVIEKTLDKIVSAIGRSLVKTIQKYEEEVKGIANALTGNPSTPWHVTIGNPLRPIFCAGDLYPSDNVTLKLGPNLAFNDLPSSVSIEFTLTNARPWGLQEILGKFNTGNLRTVNLLADASQLPPDASVKDGIYVFNKDTGSVSEVSQAATNGAPTTQASGTNTPSNNVSPGTQTGSPSKEGVNQETVNKDAASEQPVVEGDLSKTITTETPSSSGTVGEQLQVETAKKDDPVADANATTKRGYKYEIKTRTDAQGLITYVSVVDGTGTAVTDFYNDSSYTPPTDTTALIKAAKTAVNDN